MNKFKYAFSGIVYGLKQKAIRIQLILGIMAIIGGFLIRLDVYEWLAFIICIGLVISLEFLNSVIEEICDVYCKEYDERIMHIKDIAAAAVLIVSITSLVVCIICVLRRII